MIKLIKSSFFNEKAVKTNLCRFIAKSGLLSMSNQCRRFEERFSAKQNRKYSVFVSSGSMANLVLLQSLMNTGKLKKGDAVGVSAITWSTNVMPVIQLGLHPVVIDCEIETLNVSSRTLKHVLAGRSLKALFITNVLGLASDLREIKKMCDKKNILLLEDNCESLGSKLGNKLLGNFGLASTFSFFVGHHLSTIEGGMICTDDKKLYEMLLISREHGWDRRLLPGTRRIIRKRYRISDFYSLYTFYDLAYNARPTEIQGYIGNEQLKYWNKIVSRRQNNFSKFYKAASSNGDIIELKTEHMSVVSNFAMPLVFKTEKLYAKYLKRFQNAKVEVRPIVAGNIAYQPFFRKYIKNKFNCPQASFIHKHGFYFGNNPEMTKKEIDVLCKLLQK
jgi:CDP-4-dehydro-6-deoxyglucose reductase, E1